LHRFRGEPEAVQKYAREGVDLAVEGGLTTMQAWGNIELGWSQAMQGEVEEGIARMQKWLTVWRAKGTELGVPDFLLALAEGHHRAGQAENGLRFVEEALASVERTGERVWEAEVYRVQGELLQLSGRISEAEASFRQAVEVARRQEARSLELRSTISLSRLLQKEGRSEEARQLLSEIYGWFTEGFDAPDLREAKALLERLG
jgi:adenylate cyclase